MSLYAYIHRHLFIYLTYYYLLHYVGVVVIVGCDLSNHNLTDLS